MDGEKFIPVFSSWKQDKPVYDGHPDWNKKPVEVIRKGQVVRTIKPIWDGRTVVKMLGQLNRGINSTSPLTHGKKEKVKFRISRVPQIRNPTLLERLPESPGHELPYRPSAEP